MLVLQSIVAASALVGLTTAVTNPSSQKVTSSKAFNTGAGNNNNAKTQDGTGAGNDVYKCYYGGYQNFPDKSKWMSFENMFNYSKDAMRHSCANLGDSASAPGDSDQQIGLMYNSIQQIAEASLVDHRFVLAVILQESIGCVNVKATKNPNPDAPDNPGLMQSAGGVTFVGNGGNNDQQQASITQMIIDGTQGTSKGDGLVQGINMYGDIYSAARYYNSGFVNQNNLNDGGSATNSYVNDIANRMTGWVYAAPHSC